MLIKQSELMESLLFDDYLVSSRREQEVFSPFTHYLESELHDEMVKSAEVLDGLIRRMMMQTHDEGSDDKDDKIRFEMGEFPMRREIMNLSRVLGPFFWTRYDAFCREKGGIFFSEFNYDKPCAQREILLSAQYAEGENPNVDFKEKFCEGFWEIWQTHRPGIQKPKLAVLIDPGHFEEVHLAYLYKDLLGDLCEEIILAGSPNFYVEGEKVFAFNQEVDIILRQFPTEFLYEVNHFEQILKLHNESKVLLLNDPRAIIGQSKSLFAYLWALVEGQDPFLTTLEVETIQRTIPRTWVYHKGWIGKLIQDKDWYVVKPIYGRYSIDVFIGKMHTDEEWLETLAYVDESEKSFVVQEFCPIKPEATLKFENIGYEEKRAFANYGVYLINGSYGGSCIRWSNNYLSEDDVVWTSPLAIKHQALKTLTPPRHQRNELWQQINEEAAFEWGYTGGYTGFQESFTLQAMVLSKSLKVELEKATNEMCELIQKTVTYVQNYKDILCPVLGIDEGLRELVSQKLTKKLVFIGRMDWVLDNQNNLKLLEFNSETPAGLIESLALGKLIKQFCGYQDEDPNAELANKIRATFCEILEDYQKDKEIKTIGFISSNYYEDWYNTALLYDLVKDLPYDFVMGDVAGLRVESGKLWHSEKPLDAVYRFYPLDWFVDPYFDGVTEALQHNTLSINPPSTLICQSKAFFALVWELAAQGFYEAHELNLISRYLPKTALSPKKVGTNDFVAKAYFGREGQDVFLNYTGKSIRPSEGDYVFQERVDIQGIDFERMTTLGEENVTAYPIIGTYVVGKTCEGLFVRAGGRITDQWATFMPAYVGSN